MNLPSSIPTDNLYKFMAITGLVLIILSLYWYNKNLREIALESIELRSQVQLMAEKNFILDEKKKIVEAIKNSTSEEALAILNQRAELLREAPTITKRWEQLFFMANEFKKQKWIIFAVIVLGVGITTVGFYLWYIRLQKYQDILMKKEAGDLLPFKDGNPLPVQEVNINKDIDMNVKTGSNKSNSADAKSSAAD